ncbi:MAG: AAA family ATPase [Flavobacteriales bacterium]|nr:AAA family ATPase [Flavobacteriales bacterium]
MSSTPPLPIARIAKIKDHRVFRDFAWPTSLHDFARFNLVYGYNGSGKSTLSKLFEHIAQRRVVEEGQADFIINAHPVNGDALDTAANLPQVRVFDREAVVRTIAEADSELGPIYYFGEENVESQKKLETESKLLEKAKKDLEAAQLTTRSKSQTFEAHCTDKGREIKTLLSGTNSTYLSYNSAKFKKKADELMAHVGALPTRTDEQKTALKQKAGAISMTELSELVFDYPDLNKAQEVARELLARTVTSKVIDRLVDKPVIAKWVEEGLHIHSGDEPLATCEFCGNTLTSERMKDLDGHFNDVYKAFVQDLTKARTACEHRVSAIAALVKHDPAKLYSDLSGRYQEKLKSLKEADELVAQFLNALAKGLSDKAANPFQSLHLDTYLDGLSVTASDAASSALAVVNVVLQEHNARCRAFDKSVLEARKELEAAVVADTFSTYQKNLKAVTDSEANEKRLGDDIRGFQETVTKLEMELKEHRTPAEQLNKELCGFLGRGDLSVAVHETGYTVVRDGIPALNLSEGEKTAIAFLYFLKSLHDKTFNLGKGIVVIDDPVSSLDAHALFSAFGQMKQVVKEAGQLFVLTHNSGFFRQVKNWFESMNRWKKDPTTRPARFFMLSVRIEHGHRNAAITVLDPLLERFESEYHYLFKQVHVQAQQTSMPSDMQVLYPLPNIARRLLEAFLAFKVPSPTSDGLMKKLDLITFDPAKKTRMLRFTHSYSHSDRIEEHGMDMSLLAEAPQVMREVLELIQFADPQHYDGMMEQIVAIS